MSGRNSPSTRSNPRLSPLTSPLQSAKQRQQPRPPSAGTSPFSLKKEPADRSCQSGRSGGVPSPTRGGRPEAGGAVVDAASPNRPNFLTGLGVDMSVPFEKACLNQTCLAKDVTAEKLIAVKAELLTTKEVCGSAAAEHLAVDSKARIAEELMQRMQREFEENMQVFNAER